MDAGSMASTTDRLDFLSNFQSLHDTTPTLRVADDTPHYPTGIGFLKVPTIDPPGYASVQTFYTPSLPATILSPTSIASNLKCLGYSSFANLDGQNCHLTLHGCENTKITFLLQLQHGLLFTQPLQWPKPRSSVCMLPLSPIPHHANTPSDFCIHHLSKAQLSHLWHQCFGHLNQCSVATMHHFVKGVPPIPLPTNLDSCPVCLSSKLHCAAHGQTDICHATKCYQGISVDFGFFIQQSADATRYHQLQGINGETCYCLIVCHHSGMLFGEPFCSKAPQSTSWIDG